MTYKVFGGTLSLTQSIMCTHSIIKHDRLDSRRHHITVCPASETNVSMHAQTEPCDSISRDRDTSQITAVVMGARRQVQGGARAPPGFGLNFFATLCYCSNQNLCRYKASIKSHNT